MSPWRVLGPVALLLALAVAAFIATRGGPGPGQGATPPPAGAPPAHGASRGANVVIVLIDTLRADRLGSYGFDADTAPELDALAAGGVRFARPISQSPWTRPSIGSIITSLYPRTIGIYDERDQILNDRFTTFAEVLQRNGYTSIGATANPNTNTAFNFHQGYDQYVDSTVRFAWMDEEVGDQGYKEAPLQSARDVFTELLGRVRALEQPPYHLMATIMDVHEAHDDRVDLSAHAEHFEGRSHARYLRAIREVSGDIDWFRAELSKLPGWEHTLFVIISDHGQGLDSHPDVQGGRWHGWLAYESQVVVPFILHSSGDELPRGVVVERPVRMLDVMPTLLDLLGLAPPAGLQGTSLRALLGTSAPPPPLPEAFVVETQLQEKHTLGLYTDAWKYIEHRVPIGGTDPFELQVPGGGENGAATSRLKDHPDVAGVLRKKLAAWERAHPAAPPTAAGAAISDEMAQQLRSLGYLGDEPGDTGKGAAAAAAVDAGLPAD